MSKTKRRSLNKSKTKSKNKSMKRNTRLSRKKSNIKMRNMHGCGHTKFVKSCLHCKTMMQKGGFCSSCGIHQNGGASSNPSTAPASSAASASNPSTAPPPASPIPGPFIGNAWNGSVQGWPGVNGVGADRNYLAQNMYFKDPQTMMITGGKKCKKCKNSKNSNHCNHFKTKKTGGGLIPQDLVNLGRDMMYNMGSAYNSFNGYPQPVNPAPYIGQIPSSKSFIL